MKNENIKDKDFEPDEYIISIPLIILIIVFLIIGIIVALN